MALPLTGAEAQLKNSEYPYTTEVDTGDDKLNHRVEVHGTGLAEAVDTVSKSLRVTETDPARFAMVSEDLSPADNLAAATYYYPSSDGVSMLGFKSVSFAGELTDGGGTANVLTCEMRNIDTGTWIPVTNGLDSVTAAAAASISSAAAGTLYNWQFDDFNGGFVRLKLVVSDATNTNEITMNRTAI